MHTYLRSAIEYEESLASLLNRMAAVLETRDVEGDEQCEEIRKDAKKLAESTPDRESLETAASQFITAVDTLLTAHAPDLLKSFVKTMREVLGPIGHSFDDVRLVYDRLESGVVPSPEETAKALERATECRWELYKAIYNIETAIERYMTDL